MSQFQDYKQLELGLLTVLDRLLEVSRKLQNEGSQTALLNAVERLSSGKFTLAVVGEFKRGKSTLINALLGEDILPTDVLPTTATLNRLVYGLEKRVTLHKRDGSREDIAWDQLANYVTKLDDEAAERAQAIREAVIEYPCNYCRNNVELIDTPGLQDDAAMSSITLAVLPKVDAAVMVVSALSPLSESELAFLEKLGQDDYARVFLVVTSIDRLAPPGPDLDSQVERLLDALRQRLQRLDPAVLSNLHPQIFAVSPYQALRARKAHDASAIISSRFPAFEGALESFLGGDRGRAALQIPLAVALRARSELDSGLQQKRSDSLKARREATSELKQAETVASLATHSSPPEPFSWAEFSISSHGVPWLKDLRRVCDSAPEAALQDQLEKAYLDGVNRFVRSFLDTLYLRWDSLVDCWEQQWGAHSSSRCPAVGASKAMMESLESLGAKVRADLRCCYPLTFEAVPRAQWISKLEQSWTTPLESLMGPLRDEGEALFEQRCRSHATALDLVARDNAVERLRELHCQLARLEHEQARMDDWQAAIEGAAKSLKALELELVRAC